MVFCNNSGKDISDELNENSGRIEFLSFYGNDYEKSLGKGYGEARIIEYALQNSSFIKNAKTIIKITGKLKVLNIQKALLLTNLILGNKYDSVYCTWVEPGTIDSRVFCGSPHFFNYLVNNKHLMNDSEGVYFENVLHNCICQYSSLNFDYGDKNDNCFYEKYQNVSDFVIPLEIDGYSWTSGNKYYLRRNKKIDEIISIKEYLESVRKTCKNTNIFITTGGGICKLLIFSIDRYKKICGYIKNRIKKRAIS